MKIKLCQNKSIFIALQGVDLDYFPLNTVNVVYERPRLENEFCTGFVLDAPSSSDLYVKHHYDIA